MKRIAVMVLGVIGILGAGTMVAQDAKPAAKDGGAAVVASVNGTKVTKAELDQMWNALNPEMQTRYEATGGKKQLLDNYIRKLLVVQKAEKEGFDKQPSVAISIAEARDSAIFDRYLRDVIASQVVTDADVQAYYDAHKNELERPEMVKARHILVTPDAKPVKNLNNDNATTEDQAKAKIEKLKSELAGHPENFAKVAKEASEDPTTAAMGGELGWFPKGRMVPEFDKAAFELAPGKVSDVVKSKFGYHLILVEQHRNAEMPTFAEAKTSIRARLVSQKIQQVLGIVQKMSDDLMTSGDVKVYEENF